ncbi:peptidylprolyl isomerase [Lacinutrix mariniflava]|uniref:peptidylprolyl isomerase n=1 Tax=Lacinutrix mariniflava TaxID=342955 RepID=UPI0006E2C682|nr:peptidylprolyl isomerase [Lacinutrix mariniflava]
MKIRYLSFFFTFIFTSISLVQAQAQTQDVLFTIDDEQVYASDFIRVYNKNLDLVKDESQKDIDGYLKLFINYKLKLKEAKRLELDKKTSYLREFESYKKQLAANYLTDNKVTDALIKEAHNRLKTEVNASHVLVRIEPSASPKDTLIAYNQILKLRDRVLNEGYKAVQKEVHNGKTIFAEDLGYFSAFKMVYPFENAAFNTNVGEVSQPFRTRFGYHVVNVFNKREARGEVSVAHIMIKTDKKNDKESETKIKEIYKRIQQGEAFDALAKQLSEDKSTSSKGGMLNPFSSGEISASEFEEVAFGLENIDDVSKPFKTQFGWHIVKLKAKKGIASFEEMKQQLESKIKRDSRSKVINDSRIKGLKERYTITENTNDLNYFKEIVSQDYFNNSWSLPLKFEAEKTFFKIQERILTYNDFGEFLIKNQRNYYNKITEIANVVDSAYESFLENELQKYQEDNLIIENIDYAQIVGEYRDGLLLFDLMETEIWNVAKNDSVALENYYSTHESSYFFPERINAVVASSVKKNIVKKIAKLMEKDVDIEGMKNLVNTKGQVNVSFSSGEMDKKHQALPEDFSFKIGVSKVYKHNDAFVVVNVSKVLPKRPKTFEEAKGLVTSDYQIFKEENWLKELQDKYLVKVNPEVLKSIKQTLKN